MKRNRHMIRLLVLALLLSWLVPGRTVAYAATKQFTYAEQKTGIAVESLVLESGDKIDLKFIGIKDYKKYNLKWTSSNEAVATVDKQGIITAKSTGTAVVRLVVGNGTEYNSRGVTVTVGTRETVVLGTSKNSANSPITLPLGTKIDLNYYGVTGWSAARYTCKWSSTNPNIAKVDQSGIVTPHKEGTTVIMLSLTDNFFNKQLTVLPVAVTVVSAARPTTSPQPTPTPRPTWPTPTPIPTWPTPTPTIPWPSSTPQPTQAPITGSYRVTVASASSVVLEFPSAVSYGKDDIRLYRVFKNGSQSTEYEWAVARVTSGANGTKLTVEAENSFSNGDTYIVKVGTNDKGTEFVVSLGTPNRIVVTYECLGAEGVAYAQTSIDAPVTLSYRLYHDSVDVTKEYASYGYVEYEMLSPTNSYKVDLAGDELTFYEERTTAVIRATYYYGGSGSIKLASAPISIVSQSLGAYTLRSIEEWTIIDDTKQGTMIDWSKPVHAITAGEKDKKIVLLFVDAFGIRYSTDYRGVNEEQGIYSIEDTSKLFAANGCTLSFDTTNSDKLWVDYNGAVEAYGAASRATVSVMAFHYYDGNARESRLGTISIQIRKEAQVASIDAETKTVSLVTETLPGYESLSRTRVKINAFDQYGNPWMGDCQLDLRSTTKDVNDALASGSGPAYLDGTTLVIDAEAISKLVPPSRTSVAFVVTEVMINKKTTITVALKAPAKDKNGEITVNAWEVGAENVSLSFSKEEIEAGQNTKYATVGLYQLSKGNIRVGLYDDSSKIFLETNKNFKPTSGNVDDIFVIVTGPDGKVVPVVNNPNECGVYWDEGSRSIRIIVAAPESANSNTLNSLASGQYTIRAMKIASIANNGKPNYATKTVTFTVTDDTSNIVFRDVKNTRTETYVSGKDDIGSVTSIIEELFTFTKDGALWEDWTTDMITDVEFTWTSRTVTVRSIEFLVPAGDGTELRYKKKVKGVGRTVQYGVYQ